MIPQLEFCSVLGAFLSRRGQRCLPDIIADFLQKQRSKCRICNHAFHDLVLDVTSHYLHCRLTGNTGPINQDLVWKGTILGCEHKEAWNIRGHFGGWLPHYTIDSHYL